jgi:LysM repeat protein
LLTLLLQGPDGVAVPSEDSIVIAPLVQVAAAPPPVAPPAAPEPAEQPAAPVADPTADTTPAAAPAVTPEPPATEPAAAEPAPGQATASAPAAVQPAGTAPQPDQTAATETATAEPAPGQVTAAAPSPVQPAGEAPQPDQTAATEPAAAEPAPGQVTAAAPAAGQPAGTAPQADKTATDEAETAAAAPAAAAGTAVQPASSLLLTQGGVSVLRGPDPAAGVQIDSIAYSDTGAVQVAGMGGAGGTVRLYLDGKALMETLTDDRGRWAGTLPPVNPGLYTLRADLLDGAGKVVARAETPFLREPPEALAAAAAAAAAPQAAPVPDPAAAPSSGDAPAAAPAAAVQVVTVQPGFTLWGIARETYGAGVLYVKVFEANRSQIRNPDLIYPGQVFTLPQGN